MAPDGRDAVRDRSGRPCVTMAEAGRRLGLTREGVRLAVLRGDLASAIALQNPSITFIAAESITFIAAEEVERYQRARADRSAARPGLPVRAAVTHHSAEEADSSRPPQPAQSVIRSVGISAEDRLWLAGYLEGEGSFQLRKKDGRALLAVETIDRDVAHRVAGLWGVKLNAAYVRRENPKKRPTYKVSLYGAPAVAVMKSLLPLVGERAGKGRSGRSFWTERGCSGPSGVPVRA